MGGSYVWETKLKAWLIRNGVAKHSQIILPYIPQLDTKNISYSWGKDIHYLLSQFVSAKGMGYCGMVAWQNQ